MRSGNCPLGLTKDLTDGGQASLIYVQCKAKPNQVFKTVFSPWLATVNHIVGN